MELSKSDNWYSTGNYARVKALKVFYKREGHGENLFCIHGFPSSSWDFEPIWTSLTAKFDVIAHDLIGLGMSAKPAQELTVGLQADILEELALQQGVKKAHILAHDLGDTIAQELLARQLEKSSPVEWLSCTFLNGGLFPETHRPLLVQKLLLSPFGNLITKFMTKKTFAKNMNRIFSPANPPSPVFIDETWKLTSSNNGLGMIPKLIRYMEERKTHRERWVKPLVDKIVPVRLIDGVDDPISGLHLTERYQTIVPEADVVLLESSGHYPHVETPEAVVKAFLQFHESIKT